MIFWTHPRMYWEFSGAEGVLVTLLAVIVGAIIAWWFFGRNK